MNRTLPHDAAAGAPRATLPLGTLALLAALAAGGTLLGAPHAWLLLGVAPLLEEAAFRAGLHEALLRHAGGLRFANLATALAFGAAHVAARGDAWAFAVAGPALAIGLVYEHRRRLRDCVMLHAAMNAAWLAAATGWRP